LNGAELTSVGSSVPARQDGDDDGGDVSRFEELQSAGGSNFQQLR
jgi:hypothetical protein